MLICMISIYIILIYIGDGPSGGEGAGRGREKLYFIIILVIVKITKFYQIIGKSERRKHGLASLFHRPYSLIHRVVGIAVLMSPN